MHAAAGREDEKDEEQESLLVSEYESVVEHTRERTAWSTTYVILTTLNVLLFICTAVFASMNMSHISRSAFPTDLRDARSAVQYETRTFTGALEYDPQSGKIYRELDAEREFFGPSSSEIDEAWEDLLRGEFPVTTEEEASPYLPELRRLPNTHQYHFEPDMFHSLHCLNAIRNHISEHLYNTSTVHPSHTSHFPSQGVIPHIEHCMDRIRQSIICHGDLSPSPMYWWDGFNLAFGRAGEHTCRKWEPIREWMDERGKKGPALHS